MTATGPEQTATTLKSERLKASRRQSLLIKRAIRRTGKSRRWVLGVMGLLPIG